MKNSNNEFIIASKSKSLLKLIYGITMNVPKRDYFIKDKINNISFDLLKNIYYLNNNKNIEVLNSIKTDISLIDFFLEILYEKKYINKRQLSELSNILIVLTRMTSKWVFNIEAQNA